MRYILNGNAASIRVDDRGIKDLADDIEDRGLILPVLVAPDNLILSGCRRVAAMDLLGWTRVPVVVTDDWERVVEHFKNEVKVAADLGLPSEPLYLREFDELVDRRLRQIFEPERRRRLGVAISLARASRGNGLKAADRKHPNHHRNSFTDSVIEMLNMPATQVTTSREIMAKVKLCKERSADLGLRAEEALDKVQRYGGRLHSLKRMLGDMLEGRENVQYRLLIDGPAVVQPAPQKSREPDRRLAEEQVAAINRLLDMYEALGDMVREIGDLNVAVDPETVAALQKRYGNAQRKVGVLRSYLNNVNSRRESNDA
jgi:hypothetical protein